MRLDELNGLDAAGAAREFLRCCGSSRWAARMAESRPFADRPAMAGAADRAFEDLGRADWLEAFAAHPKIGAGGAGNAGGAGWSDQEQAGVAGSATATRQRLDQANRDYEARFGYIFIVCATGKTGPEMLGLLQRRLDNDPDKELWIAANEQKKITQLRLTKLLGDDQDKNR
jgi:OHCU decarboxylase